MKTITTTQNLGQPELVIEFKDSNSYDLKCYSDKASDTKAKIKVTDSIIIEDLLKQFPLFNDNDFTGTTIKLEYIANILQYLLLIDQTKIIGDSQLITAYLNDKLPYKPFVRFNNLVVCNLACTQKTQRKFSDPTKLDIFHKYLPLIIFSNSIFANCQFNNVELKSSCYVAFENSFFIHNQFHSCLDTHENFLYQNEFQENMFYRSKFDRNFLGTLERKGKNNSFSDCTISSHTIENYVNNKIAIVDKNCSGNPAVNLPYPFFLEPTQSQETLVKKGKDLVSIVRDLYISGKPKYIIAPFIESTFDVATRALFPTREIIEFFNDEKNLNIDPQNLEIELNKFIFDKKDSHLIPMPAIYNPKLKPSTHNYVYLGYGWSGNGGF